MFRPVVSVYSHEDSEKVLKTVRAPHVFCAPIRSDLVNFVHDQLSKNTRQAHGVSLLAGTKHSAASWGTGRAVARIPRIKGSGTHRSGQAAFGNMCRKGKMGFPLKTWRRFHRKVNLKQRRHALASALAATAVTPLVLARGHRVSNIKQLPLVVDDKFTQIEKTKNAMALFARFGLNEDVQKVADSKRMRPGKGKMRNGRFTFKKGPLVIVHDDAVNFKRAVRNIKGVDVLNVNRLNIMKLAPGGQMGRLTLFTESAFVALEKHFGSYKGSAVLKKGYNLQKNVVSNADISRVINSNEIQSVLNDKKSVAKRSAGFKKNPLKNKSEMFKLNPYSKILLEANKKKKVKKINKKSKKTIF